MYSGHMFSKGTFLCWEVLCHFNSLGTTFNLGIGFHCYSISEDFSFLKVFVFSIISVWFYYCTIILKTQKVENKEKILILLKLYSSKLKIMSCLLNFLSVKYYGIISLFFFFFLLLRLFVFPICKKTS